MYASGRTTGCVVDSGDGISHTVPIYEGFAIPHAIQKIPLAGIDLTNYLQKLLAERGLNFSTAQEMDIVKDIKETMCYVVGDFELAMKEAGETHACDKNYELPDGKKILIGNERFRCAEAFFNPSLVGNSHKNIGIECFDTIMKCHDEMSVRRDFFRNIIMAGGSTLFEGLSERMHAEVYSKAPVNCKV